LREFRSYSSTLEITPRSRFTSHCIPARSIANCLLGVPWSNRNTTAYSARSSFTLKATWYFCRTSIVWSWN